MTDTSDAAWRRHWFVFSACGILIAAGSAAMMWISLWFTYDSLPQQRPILGFVLLMSLMFAVHLVAFRAAKHLVCRYSLAMIWLVAIVSRAILLPSFPIQEVDIYRYVWDGQASVAGVSPFRYSPANVIEAVQNGTADPQLERLAKHARDAPAIEKVLRRVHYGELPTVYPTVSQGVFAVTAWLTPSGAPIHSQVVAMKLAIVCFDLATLGVVFWLLRMASLPRAWAITYGWNPLVLKEFSGSGHLDSIAVFFTVLSLALASSAFSRRPNWTRWLASSACLALGVGAKLYPIVLLPVLFAACLRHAGAARTTASLTLFLLVTAVALAPVMLASGGTAVVDPDVEEAVVSQPSAPVVESPAIAETLEPPIQVNRNHWQQKNRSRSLHRYRPPQPTNQQRQLSSRPMESRPFFPAGK